MTEDVIAIVWSPRRVEESLASHEQLGFKTAFIVGYTEHEGCEVANWIVRENPAHLYLMSYDDQIVTRAQADEVLELQQQHPNDVVSGWQLLGMDSPYASAVKPSWGSRELHAWGNECFYTHDEVCHGPRLLESIYFPFALTAIPRQHLLNHPFRALSGFIADFELLVWPSINGHPYDKGSRSDWTMAMDLMNAGVKIWTARDAQVTHLAPHHGVPAHKFWRLEDQAQFGADVYWDRRPR